MFRKDVFLLDLDQKKLMKKTTLEACVSRYLYLMLTFDLKIENLRLALFTVCKKFKKKKALLNLCFKISIFDVDL